jgi:hypothetical protein
MGLDMYAYRIDKGILTDEDQVDFNDKLFTDGNANDGVDTDFSYWRKFNILHGWMQRLYVQKNGTKESFNCTTLRLMPADIDRLEADAKAGENLTPTSGFFFGPETQFDVEDRDEIMEFVAKCREAFEAGDAVAYDSWW